MNQAEPSQWIGKPISSLDTPALLLDVAAMERNLARMMAFLTPRNVKLRPHIKIHKGTTEIARLQLAAGAVGLTCAKVSEAEVLVEAGFKDILIANQIVGPAKIARLMQLEAAADVKVAVDSLENVQELARAAEQNGARIGVLVEVNIGHNRCGVAPFEPALHLARQVQKCPGLVFKGLMGYDGHCTVKVKAEERGELSLRANRLLAANRKYLEKAGIPVEIVSGAGTFTYRYAAEVQGISEVQAGTFLLMDTAFHDFGVTEFDCTLSVLATITSRPSYEGAENLAIIDTGGKTLSIAYGNPEVKTPAGGRVISLSDEHGRLNLPPDLAASIGDKVELWVRDANGTINHFDRFYVVREGVVEAVWRIPCRADHT